MYKTRVTRKGQTEFPAAIRKKFNIGAKSRLVWSAKSNVIEVMPLPDDPIKALRGLIENRPLRTALLSGGVRTRHLSKAAHLLDTSAILTFTDNEEGAGAVEEEGARQTLIWSAQASLRLRVRQLAAGRMKRQVRRWFGRSKRDSLQRNR